MHSAEGSGGRITQAGLAARSPEGTAAKGMAIKGHEDLWVEIQANTFRNWVNETLKPMDIKVIITLTCRTHIHNRLLQITVQNRCVMCWQVLRPL